MPVILNIHGGGWSAGSKDSVYDSAIACVQTGMAVISVEYRLTGEACFPAQLHDLKAAVRWVRANASVYNFDPDHIGCLGGSAGGHLASILAVTGDQTDLEGDGGNAGYSSRVQACLDGFGVSDFQNLGADLVTINPTRGTGGEWSVDNANSSESKLVGAGLQEDPDRTNAASPITFVTSDDPPFMIIHGEIDDIIPIAQSERLDELLRSVGVTSSLTRVADHGHGFLRTTYDGQIAEFFGTYLRSTSTETATPRRRPRGPPPR
jgi:acetyl esterase/lipase